MFKGKYPKPNTPFSFNTDLLRKAVNVDQGISGDKRSTVNNWLNDPEFVGELQTGAMGSAIAYLLSKYVNLSPKAQILMSLAGFGVGKLIYDYKQGTANISSFNPVVKMYELK